MTRPSYDLSGLHSGDGLPGTMRVERELTDPRRESCLFVGGSLHGTRMDFALDEHYHNVRKTNERYFKFTEAPDRVLRSYMVLDRMPDDERRRLMAEARKTNL